MAAKALFVGGEWITGGRGTTAVADPFDGSTVADVSLASLEDLDAALAAADRAYRELTKHQPDHERSTILRRTSEGIEARSEEFARTICRENGKPIRDARGEVARAVQTFGFAADEAKRIYGEVIPMSAAKGAESRMGLMVREPLGVVAAITPFNFPLNLVAHKVAPAIAAGNTVVLKPPTQTPLSSLLMAEVMQEAGVGPGVLNVLVGGGKDIGEPLVQDDRVRFVSFTGSVPVGERIRQIAGLKRLTLELGSNSPLLVFADADLEAAAAAATRGAFAYSGQVCISVQRILVDRAVEEPFLDLLLPKVQALRIGNPLDEDTDIGPMITLEDAERIEGWIREAVSQGARVLCGGEREGERFFRPTLLAGVRQDMRVVCQEAFAPVATVQTFDGTKEAVALANDSIFGLQAGLFTQDLDTAWAVARELQVGGVWVNDSPITRFDHYPYGGAKSSGLGREGVKYAVEEMTEPKFIGWNLKQPG